MEKLIFFGLVIPILFFVLYLGTRAIMSGVSAKQANQANKDENDTDDNNEESNTDKSLSNELEKLNSILNHWDEIAPGRTLIFCDEKSVNNPKKILEQLKLDKKIDKWALLIGPEGGFSDLERDRIYKITNLKSISLGPRILRSDTAIVSALTLFHSVIGDWV